MKSIELKTKEIAEAYNIISAAKYQKLSDDDKVRVWRVSRKLCPVAEQYEKEVEDAKKKLLPSEDFPQRLQVALQYQSIKDAGGKDFPISQEEFNRTAAEWNNYNGLLNKALKEIAEKMFIAVNTVMTHRRNISRKLEIHSPAGLTIYAIVNGLIRLEDVKL